VRVKRDLNAGTAHCRDMNSSRLRLRTVRTVAPFLFAAALPPFVVACGDVDTAGMFHLVDANAYGHVAFAVTGPDELVVTRASLRITDAAGRILVDEEVEPGGDNAVRTRYFPLLPGKGYEATMQVAGEGAWSCAGRSRFDVSADESLDVVVVLPCEGLATGEVSVVGTLQPGPSCPRVTLDAEDVTASVGESVALSASAPADSEVTLAWSATVGEVVEESGARASYTCTTPGEVSVTLTSTIGECSDSASATITCVAASAEECSLLARACHVVSPGSGELHDCHELGHAGDEAACSEGAAACAQACGAALCEALGPLCHEVDPGSGPLHECHELGHAGDAAQCFERGRECFDLCSAAHEAGAQTHVTLTFAARVGAEPFACGTTYEGVGTPGVPVEPRDLRLFVSDMRLLRSDGVEVPLALAPRAPWQSEGVTLLDFENAQGACANGDAATNAEVTGTVPVGEYTGIVFSTAVPQALNHDDPATLTAPLAAGGMAWSWLMGFRFLRAELAGVGNGAGALFHLGSAGCGGNPAAGAVSCARPNRNEVRLSGADVTQGRVVIDVGALFAGVDLSQNPQCHGSNQGPCGDMLDHLGLVAANGQVASGQTVFRLE
jgi:uncharacterized repeat protein (TIGR04052 family)